MIESRSLGTLKITMDINDLINYKMKMYKVIGSSTE